MLSYYYPWIAISARTLLSYATWLPPFALVKK